MIPTNSIHPLKTLKTVLLALALSLGAAAPAIAQPEEPSPGELAAARELLEVMQVRDNLIRTIEAMLNTEGVLPEDVPEGFDEVMQKFFAEHFRYEDLEPGYLRMYTDLFTEAELRDLTTMFRSPAGRRMVELTPQMAVRTQQLSNEAIQAALPELMSMMMELVADEMGGDPDAKPRPNKGRP